MRRLFNGNIFNIILTAKGVLRKRDVTATTSKPYNSRADKSKINSIDIHCINIILYYYVDLSM